MLSESATALRFFFGQTNPRDGVQSLWESPRDTHSLPWSPRMQPSMKKHLLRGWKVGQLCLAATENIHHSSPQVNSCHLRRDRMWWKIGKKPLYFYLFFACHPAAALARPSIRASAKIAHVMMHWLVCRLDHGRLRCYTSPTRTVRSALSSSASVAADSPLERDGTSTQS